MPSCPTQANERLESAASPMMLLTNCLDRNGSPLEISSLPMISLPGWGDDNMGHENSSHPSTALRYIHEILFSFTTSFLAVSCLFMLVPMIVSISRLESRIEFFFLHISYTDLMPGYFEILVPFGIRGSIHFHNPSIVPHNTLHERNFANDFWRHTSSVTTVVLVLLFPSTGWPLGWPYRGTPFELVFVAICAVLYLNRKWPLPRWISVSLLLTHYVFWYWTTPSHLNMPNYAGPIAPVLGFLASLVWGVYFAQQNVEYVLLGAPSSRGLMR